METAGLGVAGVGYHYVAPNHIVRAPLNWCTAPSLPPHCYSPSLPPSLLPPPPHPMYSAPQSYLISGPPPPQFLPSRSQSSTATGTPSIGGGMTENCFIGGGHLGASQNSSVPRQQEQQILVQLPPQTIVHQTNHNTPTTAVAYSLTEPEATTMGPQHYIMPYMPPHEDCDISPMRRHELKPYIGQCAVKESTPLSLGGHRVVDAPQWIGANPPVYVIWALSCHSCRNKLYIEVIYVFRNNISHIMHQNGWIIYELSMMNSLISRI